MEDGLVARKRHGDLAIPQALGSRGFACKDRWVWRDRTRPEGSRFSEEEIGASANGFTLQIDLGIEMALGLLMHLLTLGDLAEGSIRYDG